MNSAKKTNIQDTLETFHEFGFWSRVEGTKSRVEGNGSRVTCRGFLKMKIKS